MKTAKTPTTVGALGSKTTSNDISSDPVVLGKVKAAARWYFKSTGQTFEDVEQEMWLSLLKARQLRKRAKATDGLIAKIIDRTGQRLVRGARTGKRNLRRCSSLNAIRTNHEGETSELLDVIADSSHQTRLQRAPRSATDLADITRDVRHLIDRLPKELRELAQLLQNHTVSQAARILGVPRTTLYTAMKCIRELFIEQGGFGNSG